MEMPAKLKIPFASLLAAIAFCTCRGGLWGAALSGASVTPAEATANSVYKFTVVYKDPNGLLPQSVKVTISGHEIELSTSAYEGTEIRKGITYYVLASAGLDMANQGGVFDPDTTVEYVPTLTANSDGTPKTHEFGWVAEYQPPIEDPEDPPDVVTLTAEGTGPIVHDSYGITRYGGKAAGRDWMVTYPTGWPVIQYCDPLEVYPYVEQFPDEGTSTSSYIFRVHYYNLDGLPTRPWALYSYDPWNTGSYNRYESGVMLYLYKSEGADAGFQGHFMYKEDPTAGLDTQGTYILRVEPMGSSIVKTGADHWRTTRAYTSRTNRYYESLRPGRYQYFFGCSDDDFSAFGLRKTAVWPDLDDNPYLTTISAPAPPIVHRTGLNYTLGYVDMTTYMPGAWRNEYPYDCWVGPSWADPATNILGLTIEYPAVTFPQVDPGLCEVGSVAGGSRFLGTLDPYRRAVNPRVGNQTSGIWRLWAETAGGTTETIYTFRVSYSHSQGIAPAYIRVYINNSWNARSAFAGYDMELDFDGTPTADDYKEGVTYKFQTALPSGSHCYYFAASDPVRIENGRQVGGRVCRYPRRPDRLTYDGATFYDGDLPQGIDPDNASGDPTADNDIINGPYINTKPVLTNAGVNPQIGPTGTDFVFRVTYTDADGQRPYSPHVVIQLEEGGTLDNGGAIRCNMVKENTADDNYADGCVYILHTSSIPGLRLQTGIRRHYFEFSDDWGRLMDPNDRILGETVYLPQRTTPTVVKWNDGPIVNTNSVPTLSSGTVASVDGTSNDATVWNYKVTYTDADNLPPAYIIVYIGCEDSDSGLIIWDAGHAMSQLNPADIVYSDGKIYYYATRLAGDSTNPKNYYLCFAASDGVDRAQYSATTSPSSGIIWSPVETLGGSGTNFTFAHTPVVNDVPPSPLNPSYYSGPLIYQGGVLLGSSQYSLNAEDGLVVLTQAATGAITARYLFGTAGPSAVSGNTPPTLSEGKVAPAWGRSTDLFTFSVVYKDVDGPFGQAPDHVNVVIDGVRRAMAPPPGSGGVYKTGVTYRLQTTLTTGVHSFYFEATDGAGFAFFDATGSKSSGAPISSITPIEGPYINDRPTLTSGSISPNPTAGIEVSQPVTYSVTYTDLDNEAPNSGYPVVYIDNPEEIAYDGTVTAVTANTIRDSSRNWTADQFKGLPVQTTSGTSRGTVYIVSGNTKDTLTLLATNVAADGVSVGDTFSVTKLMMVKQNQLDQIYSDGMLYEARVPSLGVGNHSAHFKALVTETTIPGETTVTAVRYPPSGEISGPLVVSTAPVGNVGPTLSDYSVTPSSGTSSTTFTFTVKYTDVNGDPPALHDAVLGYIRVVIDGTSYSMTPPSSPNYTMGAVCTYSTSGLAPGAHTFHFEASDGWVITRLPISPSAEYTLNVNRRPVLSEPAVTPGRGNTGRSYVYSVKYTDLDNSPPSSIKVVIDGTETEIKDYAVIVSGQTFANGVVYSYPLPKGTLSVGAHTYYFTATDGIESATSTSTADGPYVHDNNPPSLAGGKVEPASGWNTDTYTYSVTYTDPDGDEPEYVKVYIDGTTGDKAHLMTKSSSSSDFQNGVPYTYAKEGLGAGSHTYFFEASDYLETVTDPTSGVRSGPSVTPRPTATISIRCSASPQVGTTATISGQISPPMSVNLTLKMTSPANSVTQRTVATQANGSYSYAWTPDASGTWKLQALWAGGGNYAASSSPELSVAVAGPTTVVSGLDMISVPLIPTNGFPDATFGTTPPFAVAKWLPSSQLYMIYSLLPRYSTDFDFPDIAVGQGYWIKTDQAKTLAPIGSLASTSANFSVPVYAGWNQVGCPFISELPWGNLRVTYGGSTVTLAAAATNGWVRDYGWSYDTATGNYKLVDASRSGADRTMRPWRGYWFRSFVSCQLVIPPPQGSSRQSGTVSVRTAEGKGALSPGGWEVRMIARNGDLRDESNYFGASSKPERMDIPRCLENYIDLYFVDESGGIYASDLRADLKSGDLWRFNVSTDRLGDVELTWEGVESVPGDVQLTLVDDIDNKSIQIAPRGSYTFRVDQAGVDRPFRILFEKKR